MAAGVAGITSSNHKGFPRLFARQVPLVNNNAVGLAGIQPIGFKLKALALRVFECRRLGESACTGQASRIAHGAGIESPGHLHALPGGRGRDSAGRLSRCECFSDES